MALNLSDYQLRRLEVILNPRFADRAYGYQTDVAREIAGRLKLVGGQMPERTPIHRLPGVQYDYALLQTASVWGWLAAGVLLAILALFLVSLFIERRYERQVASSLFWVIWFPMVYWMIGLFTTLVAFPKVMLKRQRARARWISPDRGKGSLQ